MSNQRWKIEYYSALSSRIPVKEFIDGLTVRTQAKVANSLELLAEFGLQLGSPHTKKVANTSLWELRVIGEKSLRFFYVAETGRKFLLLHGFIKKKQKTPRKEIKTALGRLRDYKISS